VPVAEDPAADATLTKAGSDAAPVPGDLRSAQTQPPRNRAIAATAALPRQPAIARTREAGRALPARMRLLDVVLIVCTFGLYGIVLLFKQRKRPA
jgi:hypothetical protein